jgi:hypothetical protein
MGTLTASTIPLTITHVSAVGDESLEVWLRVGAGAYVKVRDQVIANTTAEAMTLTYADGVRPGGATHYVAVRYRRGLSYTSGYGDADPGAWPVASRDSDVTLSAAGSPSNIATSTIAALVIKGVTYATIVWTWTSGESASGATFQLWYGTTADPTDPSMVMLFEEPQGSSPSDPAGSWRQGGATRLIYFFGRHMLIDGTVSPWVAYGSNPLDVSALL